MMTQAFARFCMYSFVLVGVSTMIACGGKAKTGEACEKQSDCERGAICFEKRCEAPNAEVKSAEEPEDLGEATGSLAAKTTWEVFRVARDKKEPWLNVRAKNKAKSDKVAQLSEGTEVTVLETQGKWRSIKVKSGEHKGTDGWAHICCLKPKGSTDLYWARLGADDHSNKSGTPIESAAGIVRQDRANYHAYKIRDKREDRDDDTYDDKGKRKWLAKMLKESLDKDTKRIIQKRQPLIEVVSWEDRVDVTVIEKGPKHEMSWDEAEALCMRRYCKCVTGKGKCKHERYSKCMSARGHDTGGHGCGRNY